MYIYKAKYAESHDQHEKAKASPSQKKIIIRRMARKQLISRNLELPALSNVPQNLDFDKKALSAKVLGIIDREWIALKVNELFVVEFYSRKI